MIGPQFVITEATKTMIPMFDQQGNEFTLIFHGDKCFKVLKSMTQIIEFNLSRFFSSLRGAKDGAKKRLKNADFYPIIIPDSLPLVLFLTDSVRSGKAITLALHQIFDLEKIDELQTKIYFYGGQCITIPISISRLEKRMDRAHLARSNYFQSYYMVEHHLEIKLHVHLVFDGVQLKLEE